MTVTSPAIPDGVLSQWGASPPVHLHSLLTAWQVHDWTVDVAIALQVVAAALYWIGVRRLAARGRSWPIARSASFGLGLLVLVVALDSGVASYDGSVFSVHVVQHLFLMMVAPPLLSLGAPITLALQASTRRTQTHLVRLLHTPTVVAATAPIVVSLIYYAAMWVDLESGFYRYSLDHRLIHDASHLAMFSLGCLFWWPVISVDRLPRRPSFMARVIAMFLGVPFEAFLGIALMTAATPIAAQHTLSDTHTGGALFWILTMAIMVIALIGLGRQWMQAEDREGRHVDRAGQGDRTDSPTVRRNHADEIWAEEWRRRTGAVPPVG